MRVIRLASTLGSDAFNELKRIASLLNIQLNAGRCFDKRRLCRALSEKLDVKLDEVLVDPVPEHFVDCITAKPLVDPVQIPSGRTYNRSTVEQFKKRVDPYTQVEFTEKEIVANRFVADLLEQHWNLFGNRPESERCSLFDAISKDDVALVDEILDDIDSEVRTQLETRNKDARSPLNLASKLGRLDIVDRLLKAGALVDERCTALNVTPLMTSIWHKHTAVARRLVNAGARLNLFTSGHRTPLFLAAKKSNLELVQLLVESGACIHKMTVDGQTAMSVSKDKECEVYLRKQFVKEPVCKCFH